MGISVLVITMSQHHKTLSPLHPELVKDYSDMPERLEEILRTDLDGRVPRLLLAFDLIPILTPTYFGTGCLERLENERAITSEERLYIVNETNFLSHKDVMNKSIFILFENDDSMFEYWCDIADMFAGEKRYLFWILLTTIGRIIPHVVTSIEMAFSVNFQGLQRPVSLSFPILVDRLLFRNVQM